MSPKGTQTPVQSLGPLNLIEMSRYQQTGRGVEGENPSPPRLEPHLQRRSLKPPLSPQERGARLKSFDCCGEV